MPDPDLSAYLDGEADPKASARIAAALRDDPQLRGEALALMRQRVALASVLPQLARKRRAGSRSRFWWLAAATVAAAASLAVIVLTGRQDPPASIPNVADSGAPPPTGTTRLLRLADGTVWKAGDLITTGREASTIRKLADGTQFELATETTLVVPASGAPWRLERGSVRCISPAGTDSLRDGITTSEAETRLMAGEVEVASDGDGTRIRVISGQAKVRDSVTMLTMTLQAGMATWVPSDTAAPRTEQGANGIIRGTVGEVEKGGGILYVRTRFGRFRFTPPWLNTPRGFDRAITARLLELHRGDRIAVTWFWEEHLRVKEVRLIAAGSEGTGFSLFAADAAGAAEPPPHRGDF